jgi:ArsR family transcriptional regulator
MATRPSIDAHRGLRLLQAIGEPTRFGILGRLNKGERCICELTDGLDAAQSRLSFHLKVLKDAGLVTDQREGRWMYYTINPDALQEIEEVVRALVPDASLRTRSAGCC